MRFEAIVRTARCTLSVSVWAFPVKAKGLTGISVSKCFIAVMVMACWFMRVYDIP